MNNAKDIGKKARFATMVVLSVAGLLLGWATSANADPSDAFREKFGKSTAYFREGRVAEAVTLLQDAYDLNPNPELFYNFARACEALGDQCCATDAYQKYLANASPSDRGAIEARVTTLRQEILARGESLRTMNCPITEKKRSIYPWVVTGTGVAALGTGAILGLRMRWLRQKGDQESQVAGAARYSQANSLSPYAITAVIVGSIATAAGITWEIIDARAVNASLQSHVKVPAIKVQLGLHSVGLTYQF